MSKRSTFQEVLVDNREVCVKGWRSKGTKHFSLLCVSSRLCRWHHIQCTGGQLEGRRRQGRVRVRSKERLWTNREFWKPIFLADLDKWITWPNKRSMKFIAWFSWKFAKTEVKHKIYHLQHLSPFCNWFTQKSRFIGLFELYLCFLSFICVFELYLCFRTQSMWPRAGLLVC